MSRKWKIYWAGVILLGVVNAAVLLLIPLHKAFTTGTFRGLPEGLPRDPEWNENYFLYYADGVPYVCQRGLIFPYQAGDEGVIVYNSRNPSISYHYTFFNFWLLVSVPFIMVQFIWFGFIVKVYDPLVNAPDIQVKKTIFTDDYREMRRPDPPRQLPDN